jgi:Cu2+-exporting ATPase
VDATEGSSPHLWFVRRDRAPVRFVFEDPLRPDAAEVVADLRDRGLDVRLLSGDRARVVAAAAAAAGIPRWTAETSPVGKVAALDALRAEGRRVLMVGDGLTDAPALAAASVSMSPAEAADISQTAADVVFRGERLAAVADVLGTARLADRVVRQNLAFALVYNVVAVPMAILGLVTPAIAAAVMSTSSIAVVLNALRTGRSLKGASKWTS